MTKRLIGGVGLVMTVGFLGPADLLASPRPVEESLGVWSYQSAMGDTAVKGNLIKIKWRDTQPKSPEEYSWGSLDAQLAEKAKEGLLIGLVAYSGSSAPDWLYSHGVPKVMVKRGAGNPTAWPYYFDANYKKFHKNWIHAVRLHLESLPKGIRDSVTFIQAGMGTTGDPGPWHGDLVAGFEKYSIVAQSPEWDAFFKDMSLYYYDEYKNTKPSIYVLYNPIKALGDSNFLLEKCPLSWRKEGLVSHMYHNTGEYDTYGEDYAYLNSETKGFWIRARGESDSRSTAKGWWVEAPYWNKFTLACWGLHMGLDIWNMEGNDASRAANKVVSEFYNLYGGRKEPSKSPGAFCMLVDGLDAADTNRFPESLYGQADQTNLTRYAKIAGFYSGFGAKQEDPQAATQRPLMKRNAEALDDVGWKIYRGNFQRFISQYDADGTSQGYWRVGNPKKEMFGRFARGFDYEHGKNDMYFDIDDKLFNEDGTPLNGKQSVMIRVVYFDKGRGSWELRYDSVKDGADKIAATVKKTDSGLWKEIMINVNDACFGNHCPHGTDFYLHHSDQENDLFSFVEVSKLGTMKPLIVALPSTDTMAKGDRKGRGKAAKTVEGVKAGGGKAKADDDTKDGEESE